MPLPDPEIGSVIRYAYLWRREAEAGGEKGRKDRPCVIVHKRQAANQATEVFVAPLTRARPDERQKAVAVPPATKARLGLDDEELSWVITAEVNRFLWPGPDLRRTPEGGIAYGYLPARMTKAIIQRLRQFARRRVVDREEE